MSQLIGEILLVGLKIGIASFNGNLILYNLLNIYGDRWERG